MITLSTIFHVLRKQAKKCDTRVIFVLGVCAASSCMCRALICRRLDSLIYSPQKFCMMHSSPLHLFFTRISSPRINCHRRNINLYTITFVEVVLHVLDDSAFSLSRCNLFTRRVCMDISHYNVVSVTTARWLLLFQVPSADVGVLHPVLRRAARSAAQGRLLPGVGTTVIWGTVRGTGETEGQHGIR